MWGQFTPGSKAKVAPEGKKLHRGITDRWKTGTHTTQVQDIDTGGRATLPVPGAVLEPPVPEASGSEECKMATEVSNVHAGRGRTDNRPAYSWRARRAGKRFPRSMRRASKAGAGTTSRFLGSDRKPCEPVATNCNRPPDPSLTSDKVKTALSASLMQPFYHI